MTPPVRWRLDKAKVRRKARLSPVTDQHQHERQDGHRDEHYDERQDEEGDKA